MCECKDMSMDMKTPRNAYLSAFYKRSFAYHTVKNRMPVILTQLIDNLSRNKNSISSEFGEDVKVDLKAVIGELSKLKYEIQTNKPLAKLTSLEPDIQLYNDYIDKQAAEEGETTYFNTIWLLSECYMYRRIKEAFALTHLLQDLDYFRNSKEEQFEKSGQLREHLCNHIISNIIEKECDSRLEEVKRMLKTNLWGNKCDLSISLGKVEGPGQLHALEDLEPFILTDDSHKISEILLDPTCCRSQTIDIVLDNSGYELFTDLCLMDLFTHFDLCRHVRFHVKAIPWFISDVMESDFHWTIDQLIKSENPQMRTLGNRWKEFLGKNTWEVVVHPFWTTPFEFKYMQKYAPDLYDVLSDSKLVIFKGDLNYRKLFGEKNWDPTTPPEEALQGFLPTSLLTLRTIKADIVVGLKPGVAEECEKKDPKWMENGDYGVIQFVNKQIFG